MHSSLYERLNEKFRKESLKKLNMIKLGFNN